MKNSVFEGLVKHTEKYTCRDEAPPRACNEMNVRPSVGEVQETFPLFMN